MPKVYFKELITNDPFLLLTPLVHLGNSLLPWRRFCRGTWMYPRVPTAWELKPHHPSAAGLSPIVLYSASDFNSGRKRRMVKLGSFLKPDHVGLCPLLGLAERGVSMCVLTVRTWFHTKRFDEPSSYPDFKEKRKSLTFLYSLSVWQLLIQNDTWTWAFYNLLDL